MRSTRPLLVICLLSAGACAPSAPPAVSPDPAPLELRLQLRQGDTHSMVMTTEQRSSVTVMGTEQKSEQTTSYTFHMEVLEVLDNGSARVETTYESIRLSGVGPMGPVDYDSDAPPETIPMAARAHNAMVGARFTMTLAPDGSVRELDGFEEIMDRLYEEMDLPAGPIRDNAEQMIGGMFGDEAAGSMMEGFTANLPDRPVHVGDSWSRALSMTLGFPIHVDNTWTLTDRRGGTAFVDVTSVITAGDDGVIEMGPVRLRQQLSGTQSGVLEIDEATGWTIRSRVEATMSGTSSIEGAPGAGTEMPLSMSSVITLERLPTGR